MLLSLRRPASVQGDRMIRSGDEDAVGSVLNCYRSLTRHAAWNVKKKLKLQFIYLHPFKNSHIISIRISELFYFFNTKKKGFELLKH